mmetsp:Transcript_1534/g.2164  ORF Transcript_1534/g.2164 Transcript_1534/m.2164 type:complete len:281 (-) Transcript_1534:422-1264(-)
MWGFNNGTMILWTSTLHMLLLILLLAPEVHVEGRVDGTDLAVGQWEMYLSSREHGDLYFFPLAKEAQSLKLRKSTSIIRNPLFAKRRRTQKKCTLSLFHNGTFCLQSAAAAADGCGDDGSAASPIPSLLSINGQWERKASPYCATDRFYDRLILKSYPRIAVDASTIKTTTTKRSTTNQTAVTEKVLQRGSFVLHSQLHGHYARRGRGRRQQQTCKSVSARMVRGVCLWSECNSISDDEKSHIPQRTAVKIASWLQNRKEVVGTFRARKTGEDSTDEEGK